MRFMQIESVLQTINRSEPVKNRFSVALLGNIPSLEGLLHFIDKHATLSKDSEFELWI